MDKEYILGINGIRTGLDVRPVHSNRNVIIVKLLCYLSKKQCTNLIKNISEKIIVCLDQSRLLTGFGCTIEGNFSFTLGDRVGRFEKWEREKIKKNG